MTDDELLRELRMNSFTYLGECDELQMTVTKSLHKFSIKTTTGDAYIEIDNETLARNQDNIVDRILNLLRGVREEEIINENE
jgi:hypothetical protein